MEYKEIAKDYFEVFRFNLLPLVNKAPKGEWHKWQTEEMTINDIETGNWNSDTNGIGAISGIKKLRCLDFDGVINHEIVKQFVTSLGLPIEYAWIVKSGSHKGYHIWFYCDDDSYLFKILGGEKSYYKLKLKIDGLCDHIELRWGKCYTVLPPSSHPSGNSYEFINVREGLPSGGAQHISVGRIIDTLKEFCVLENESPSTSLPSTSLGMSVKKESKVFRFNATSKDERYVKEAAEFLKGKVDNYDDYLRIGWALCSLGEKGREYFILIVKDNPRYPMDSETVLNKKYDGLLKDYRGEITLGSFLHIAAKYGWKLPKEIGKESKDYYKAAKEFLNYFYDFQFNELTQKLMWKKRAENKLIEFTDSDLNSIYITLRSEEKIQIGYEDLKRILSSDYVERFHPLIRYLHDLENWDDYDYIHELAGTVKCEEDDKTHWELCLKKWLVAVVACVLNDKEVNHTAIIFQGEQGIGKSRWIMRLVPKELSDYVFTGNIIPSDKDSKLAVVKNFIINLDELETLNREEIGFLKSLMTQKEIQIRKPYGHYEEKYIRRSSFIGSVNKKEFLNDMTGTRRFLCFEIVALQTDHNVDMNKVFAQALHLYKNRYEYWFDKNDSDEITKRNEKFAFRSIEEEKILGRFRVIKKDDPMAEFLTSTEIAEKIFEGKQITNPITRQIGMVLNKYKFEKMSKRTAGQSIKKWAVKEITSLDKAGEDSF